MAEPVAKPASAWWRSCLLALPLLILFWPGFVDHVRGSADPYRFADDAQQHFGPFVCELEGRDCSDDYVFRYLVARLPLGAHGLYALGDPRTTGKWLPYLLLATTLFALARAGHRLAGAGAAFGVCALVLVEPETVSLLGGALPRSFGLPLVALAALALVRGSPAGVAACAIAGAAFYLPVGLLLAAALALYLALPEPGPHGPSSLHQRAAWLAATAAIVLALVAPVFFALAPYGGLIGPDEVAAFPEAGEGGRMLLGNRLTDRPEGGPVLGPLRDLIADLDEPNPRWLTLLAALGLLAVARRDAGARRLLVLPLAMVLSHLAATALLPHLYAPSRYLDFAFGAITALGVAVALGALAEAWVPRGPGRVLPAAIALVGCIGVALLVAEDDTEYQPLPVQVPKADRALQAAIGRLPPDARVAGWPDGPLDAAPYLSGRRVLLTREVHNPFHRNYVLELRERMLALIDAYFATDDGPVRRLVASYGVTHLLVDFSHYEGEPPTYFLPFDEPARSARSAPGAGSYLRQLAETNASWSEGDRALVELPAAALR